MRGDFALIYDALVLSCSQLAPTPQSPSASINLSQDASPQFTGALRQELLTNSRVFSEGSLSQSVLSGGESFHTTLSQVAPPPRVRLPCSSYVLLTQYYEERGAPEDNGAGVVLEPTTFPALSGEGDSHV